MPIVNEEYGARPENLDRARRMVAAFEAALAQGLGAVSFEGDMIDEPVQYYPFNFVAPWPTPST